MKKYIKPELQVFDTEYQPPILTSDPLPDVETGVDGEPLGDGEKYD